jgi:hypothetical protein
MEDNLKGATRLETLDTFSDITGEVVDEIAKEEGFNLPPHQRQRLIDKYSNKYLSKKDVRPPSPSDLGKRVFKGFVKGSQYLNDIKNMLAARGYEFATGRNDIVKQEDIDKALSTNIEEYPPSIHEYATRAGIPEGPRLSDIPLVGNAVFSDVQETPEDKEIRESLETGRPYPQVSLKKGGPLDVSVRDALLFGADVVTDPATYLGGPIAKGLGKSGKLVGKIPYVGKVVQTPLWAASKSVQPIKESMEKVGEGAWRLPLRQEDAAMRALGKESMPSELLKKSGFDPKEAEWFSRQTLGEKLKEIGDQAKNVERPEIVEKYLKDTNYKKNINLFEATKDAQIEIANGLRNDITREDSQKLLNMLSKDVLENGKPKMVNLEEALRFKKSYQTAASDAFKKLKAGAARSTEQEGLLSIATNSKSGIEKQLPTQVEEKLRNINDKISSAYGSSMMISKKSIKEAVSELPSNISVAESILYASKPAAGATLKGAKMSVKSPRILMSTGKNLEDLSKIPIWDQLLRKNLRERVRTEAEKERNE